MAGIDASAFYKLSYGLFVLTAHDAGSAFADSGCIINTAIQLTSSPARMSIAVNKQNNTHDMIKNSGIFNLSVISEEADFSLFTRFGFKSGRDTDKFTPYGEIKRAENGVAYIDTAVCALISCTVISAVDCGTHTLFIADVTEAINLNDAPAATYAYYFAHIKSKPEAAQKTSSAGKVWVCKICGYIYDEAKEGVPFDALPDDWSCPICKHPKSDFELSK